MGKGGISDMTSKVKKVNKWKKMYGCSMFVKSSIPRSSSLLFEKNNVCQMMLKSRFAKTIPKAQEKMVKLNGGNITYKERLEKRKASTKAKVTGAQIEMMLRQKQRKVARISLEKITKNMEWNDEIQVEKEFEKPINSSVN